MLTNLHNQVQNSEKLSTRIQTFLPQKKKKNQDSVIYICHYLYEYYTIIFRFSLHSKTFNSFFLKKYIFSFLDLSLRRMAVSTEVGIVTNQWLRATFVPLITKSTTM